MSVTSETAEYDAVVIERRSDMPELKQSTKGGAKTTAAWLRALADEIDPPRSAHRPAMRGVARVEAP